MRPGTARWRVARFTRSLLEVYLADRVSAFANPGLAFVQGSEQMLDVTKIEVSYRQKMWAHCQDPPIKDDEEQTQAP
jgi:hypothetical protein